MTRDTRISVVHQADGSFDIVVPASMAEEFNLMVKKGTNCSPDMHVEIRDFADRLFKREKSMGSNMKWELPSEDKYLVETAKQELKYPESSYEAVVASANVDALNIWRHKYGQSTTASFCPSCGQVAELPNPNCGYTLHPNP